MTRRFCFVLVTAAVIAASCSSSTAAPRASTKPAPTSTTTTTRQSEPTPAQAALVAARPFTVHVPASNPGNAPAPLLILLHGYGASGAVQEGYLNLTPATDAHHMLYAYADGTTNAINKRYWNATDACCDPVNAVDDSAYVTAIIADVKSHHRVDPRRVFIVGHSNGGFMAYRMACDHADEIAAIVSLEAATWSDPGKCAPSQGVATLEIHGTTDTTIKYDGGTTGIATYPSATTTVLTWARYNGCAAKPDQPNPPARTIERSLPPATVTAYSSGCKPGGHAELWTQPNGVHIPPFDPTFPEQVVSFLLAHPKPA